MKAADLRIGNYVHINQNTTQVDVIDYNQVIATEWGLIELKYVKPIPLTEECLINFGFELINNDFFRSRNSELCLYWTVNKNKMIPEYNNKRLVIWYDFQYVHQLQNLYFALTGEELTIK